MEYASHCRLISVRQQSVEDTNIIIDENTREQMYHCNSVLDLEKENENYLEILPMAFHKLFANNMCEMVKKIMLEKDEESKHSKETKNVSSVSKDSRYISLTDAPTTTCRCRLLLQEIDRVSSMKKSTLPVQCYIPCLSFFQRKFLLKSWRRKWKE